jgi:hypothetical protein
VDRLKPATSLTGLAQLGVPPVPARIVPVAEAEPAPVSSSLAPAGLRLNVSLRAAAGRHKSSCRNVP